MALALLADRGVVFVAGEEARAFLQGLVTCDVRQVVPGRASYGALLAPQGKIATDFLLTEADAEAPIAAGLYLDVPAERVHDLVRRLKQYRLRAKIAIEDVSRGTAGDLCVTALWRGEAAPAHAHVYDDPRHAALGARAIAPAHGAHPGDVDAYEEHRIGLGVPKGGVDFQFDDAFPHEANLDRLNGVDFAKGCYVGQEVVSRVHHRGGPRKRVLRVSFEGPPPALGTPVMAGAIEIGRMGSSADGLGLALLRTDRVVEAEAAGTPILCGAATLHVIEGLA